MAPTAQTPWGPAACAGRQAFNFLGGNASKTEQSASASVPVVTSIEAGRSLPLPRNRETGNRAT